ncbi:MAG: ATP-binding protein [Rhodospirillaceae bacterium]
MSNDLTGSADSVGRLVKRVAPVGISATCAEVHCRFIENPDLFAVAVVDGAELPVGLVNRQDFFIRLAERFGWALYEKKSVTSLMDTRPLAVESAMHFEALSELIVSERPSALLTGYIVTENGRYLGVGSTMSLMQMTVEKAQARTVELERAREEAVLASSAKSRFLANVSHELRTPLNAIIGFSDMMSREVFGPLGNNRYGQYMEDINRSGLHLLQVINDILDLSKVEAGKLEPRFETLDLSEVLGSAVRMFEVDARRAGLSIRCDLAPDMPAVRADPKLLRQILINLISNAVKFTDPGGEVSIRAAARAGETRVVVHDNGIGMEPEDIPVVMQPFGQLDNDLNRRYDGTGLGLPLTRALVLAQGGTFDIESRKGVGTSVAFTLSSAELPADTLSAGRNAAA